MRNPLLLTCFVFSMLLGLGCGTYDPYPYGGYAYAAPANVGTLTVSNQSQSTLTQLFFTYSASAAWGPNLLPSWLSPGEQTVANLECAVWDVLVGDEFGRQCVLSGIEVCQTNEVWVIYEDTLRTCSRF